MAAKKTNTKTKGKPGRKRQYPDPQGLKDKIEKYFKSNKKIKSVGGLCDYLDLTYEGLDEYGRREEYKDIVKRAKQRVSKWTHEAALAGTVNPTVAIFTLKCNFGWRENTPEERKSDSQNIVEAFRRVSQELPD